MDLSGREIVATPGETDFQFTKQAHREMKFRDIDELRSYLEQMIRPQFGQRCHEVKLAMVKAYARKQKDVEDPEWVALFLKNPRWPS